MFSGPLLAPEVMDMSFVKPSRIGIGVALGAFTLAASLAGSGCGGTRQALEKQIRDL
jgi:hypothetical protein